MDTHHEYTLETFRRLSSECFRTLPIDKNVPCKHLDNALFITSVQKAIFRCTMANELVSANQITVCAGCRGVAIVLSGISHDTDN